MASKGGGKKRKIEAPKGSPERLVRFFESGEVDRHEGKFAFGMDYFSSDTKLKIRFSPEAAADVLETYGEDLPSTREVIPLATLGTDADLALAVDPRRSELPVLFFEHEAGFHDFSPSFDAFLASLLDKGQKTPLERLAGAYQKAVKLDEKKKHAEVIDLLEKELGLLPDVKPRNLDSIDESYPESVNLLGLAYCAVGRIDDALTAFARAVRLGSSMASLNLCALDLEHFKDYRCLAESARKLTHSSWLIGDGHEWYHSRNYSPSPSPSPS